MAAVMNHLLVMVQVPPNDYAEHHLKMRVIHPLVTDKQMVMTHVIAIP